MITLMMPVRNEADRYLKEILEQWVGVADRIVIVDDCSSDTSPEIARSYGAEVYRTPHPMFDKEWMLRLYLWRHATRGWPSWIVGLDADELLDPPPATWFRQATEEMRGVIGMPLYDLWDSRHTYRDDDLWTAHRRSWPIAIPYRIEQQYGWPKMDHHVGRWPIGAVDDLPWFHFSNVKILHLGWMRPSDRMKKFLRYQQIDPEAKWGIKEQYLSILDDEPHLEVLA